MTEKTNEVLIQEIINGSEEAFHTLYEKFHRMVYYIALKTMHNEADAQDVVQDVFIQVKRSIHMVKNAQYLQLWITRITVNKCNMIYRKRKEVLLDIDDHDKDANMQLMMSEPESLPQEHMKFSTDQEIIRYFIDQLPNAQRLMIVLMYYEQLSVDEIAMACDIPNGTVKSRLKIARDTLKRKIQLYEKQEQIKLNFHAHGLGGLITLALVNEAKNINLLQPMIKGRFKVQYKNVSTACFVSLGIAVTTVFGAYVYLHDREPAMAHRVDSEQIQPKQAYFTIMMWANTPTLVEMKQNEISDYRKYYEILKNEQGVYWELFLKSGINSYFE